jgi:uncharacterized protein (DUF433 family)
MTETNSSNRPIPGPGPTAEPETQPAVSWIEKTPGVCGGDARIRCTRIPVWLLVEARQIGISEEDLLTNYPSLTPADLALAWEYYEHNKPEIDEALRLQQQAMEEEA